MKSTTRAALLNRASRPSSIRRPKERTLDDIKSVKNVFGIDNGKQLPRKQTVQYFVPQPGFARLFVAKNHILIGSRGSGKTTWVRMMAHDHVMLAAKDQRLAEAYANEALEKNLIGVYVPASAAFAGDLKNKPWQTESEAEEYFVWRLNLHSCSALTHIIPSCLEQYVKDPDERPRRLFEVCRALSAEWSRGRKTATTPEGLRLILSGIELEHQQNMRRRMTSGNFGNENFDAFDVDLFLPLRHSLNFMKNHLDITDEAVWMICLDEVEYLTPLHHRILNTQIRSASGDLVFKIATMPFAHHTLATNVADPVREGNDFEYVYVDQEPIDSRGVSVEGEFLRFARELFKRRICAQNGKLDGLTLRSLLGSSSLLEDPLKTEGVEEQREFMDLLRKHANPQTILRAERLQGTAKFRSEIVRKMRGALYLRDAIASVHGNAKLRVYSGELVVVRCSDGNCRRFMRIMNSIIQRIEFDKSGATSLPVDAAVQNEVLERIARDTLSRTQSEPPNGEITAKYLRAIGDYMQWAFLSSTRRIGTDQVTSVTISASDGGQAQKFLQQAIQLSLLIPAKDVPMRTPDENCEGDFHLAFLFAPLFRLLPRRNEAVRLAKVLHHHSHQSQKQFDQVSLLDE